MIEDIQIKGARQHNLKNVDVTIPRNKLVVITGLSGSGKSSLAFDTLYAEGQRRYVESLSSYARQFLDQMEKPEVEHISGLSPAIAIEQRTGHGNPRSIVATTTEIYDYLRLLYAHVGIPHCPKCGDEVKAQSTEMITQTIQDYPEGKKLIILSPLVEGKKGEHKDIIEKAAADGYVRLRIDGEIYRVEDAPELEKNFKHNIEIVVDRLKSGKESASRLNDSIETALREGSGSLKTLLEVDKNKWEEKTLSEHLACTSCRVSFGELEPRNFSFNSPYGACKSCHGLGSLMVIDPELMLPDKTLPVEDSFPLWKRGPKRLIFYHMCLLKSVGEEFGFTIDKPFNKLTKKQQDALLFGTGEKSIPLKFKHAGRWYNVEKPFEGVIGNLTRRFKESESDSLREKLKDFMSKQECKSCHGHRLQPVSLAVTVNDKAIHEFISLSIENAENFLNNLNLNSTEAHIAGEVLREIISRLSFLKAVGLQYLTLNRESGTLSGGEAQRIRLATQLGSGLVGVLYILDEPSIGLHQRDNELLLNTLCHLRNLGNTVVVVEHDLETIERADHVIDMGPGAGRLGGEVMFSGPPENITAESSHTGAYLKGLKEIEVPTKRFKGNGDFIEVKGAEANNLKKVNAKFPLGTFTCVTGVSGSGKSTLVNEIIKKSIYQQLGIGRDKPGKCKEVKGVDKIDKMIVIDQSPIGRTPRSNPATYTDAFTIIRDLFSKVPESRMRAYKPGRFSFNVKGGRCETCKGDGYRKIEMNFLPDVYVECEVCHGRRYNKETLTIRYKGRNIADVLEMTVDDAVEFFKNHKKLNTILQTLQDVGLGYIHLGQAATTLSGGEAQRVKLASELYRMPKGHTLYILDEPTTGLHIADIHKLLEVLKRLRATGNSVLVIEHNLDVIKVADYLIDMGPEGGDNGGTLVCAGTPEKVAKCAKSHTGYFLKDLLPKN
ncbi:MAG: excinuclease ABC subunit UvrA [Lentisphaeraceae bacterium]|nr:excinuclease ABC subunit UvrA [Lentisphaeraceae bacterium]